MRQFYCDAAQNGLAFLNEKDAKHAGRVLRLKQGEEIAVVIHGQRYSAAYCETGGRAAAQLLHEIESTEPGLRITLYQGLTRGERMDYTVQKATEVGVHAIVPCLMERCVTRELGARAERLRRIAREAGKQAGRTEIPPVEDLISFDSLCKRLPRHEKALVPWEEEHAASLRSLYRNETDIALIIGPEGGITPEEIRSMSALPVTLGRRILRTETAGPVAAMLLLLSGDME